ncbi:Leucine-rich repeat-containing protein 74A [Mactra antiquata]
MENIGNKKLEHAIKGTTSKAVFHSSGSAGKSKNKEPEVTKSPGKPNIGDKKLAKEFTFTGYDILTDEDFLLQTKKPKRPEVKSTPYTQCYQNACKMLGIRPVNYFIRHLHDKTVILKSHPLGLKGVRAACIALVNNDLVEKIDFEENAFGEEGALCIAEMLKENHTITDVRLAENNIGPQGAIAFSQLLKGGRIIHTLNLSGCGLEDTDSMAISEMIEFSERLRILNISHNGVSEHGAIDIARAIVLNDKLVELDISWNHIRGKGAKAFATGIQKNVGLKDVNLAWNGLARDGAIGLGKALLDNRTLTSLDLTNNRFGMEDIGFIMKGVQQNETLRTLKIGKNPFSPDVAFTILRAIESSEKCALRFLDLKDVVVRTDFVEKLKKIQETRVHPLRIEHGAVVKGAQAPTVDPNGIDWRDPVMRMYKFMQDKGYRVIDLLKRLDKDRSLSVDREEFKAGLIAENIPMTEAQLDEVITKLDTDCDGEVDLGEMMRGEKEFRKKMKARMKKMLEQMKAKESDITLLKLAKLEEL